MLAYKASYKLQEGIFLGEVLDFPGTVSCGRTIDEVRENLADALVDMAETNLLRGEALPQPDSSRTDAEADVEEPIYLVLDAGSRLDVSVAHKTP